MKQTIAFLAIALLGLILVAGCTQKAVTTPPAATPASNGAAADSDVQGLASDLGNNVNSLDITPPADPGFNESDLNLGLG